MTGFAFRLADADRWRATHGTAAHRWLLPEICGIATTASGTMIVPAAAMAVGIYVVVDRDDHVQYIGKVRRHSPRAMRDRLAHHHAATSEWHAVWLLPLDDGCPNELVEVFESEMIRAYRPCGNTHHVSLGRCR